MLNRWPLPHHEKYFSPETFRNLAWAGSTFQGEDQAVLRINEYLIQNEIVTKNIRTDSEQADPWRDYQQNLAELGFIYSSRMNPGSIRMTEAGLALADGVLPPETAVLCQVLRYQYPNAQKNRVTDSGSSVNLLEIQLQAGVQIRPAVLFLQVTSELIRLGEEDWLMDSEVENFLMPCRNHQNIVSVAENICRSREHSQGGSVSRDAQAWVKLFVASGLAEWDNTNSGKKRIRQSQNFRDNPFITSKICDSLINPTTFWHVNGTGNEQLTEWFQSYGSLSFEVLELLSAIKGIPTEVPFATTDLLNSGLRQLGSARTLTDQIDIEICDEAFSEAQVNVTYPRAEVEKSEFLHQQLVRKIWRRAIAQGASVMEYPKSADLLIECNAKSILIECKSARPGHLRSQLRYAVGQIIDYKDLFQIQGKQIDRCFVAVSVCLDEIRDISRFVTESANMGLIGIKNGKLQCDSPDEREAKFFSE